MCVLMSIAINIPCYSSQVCSPNIMDDETGKIYDKHFSLKYLKAFVEKILNLPPLPKKKKRPQDRAEAPCSIKTLLVLL